MEESDHEPPSVIVHGVILLSNRIFVVEVSNSTGILQLYGPFHSRGECFGLLERCQRETGLLNTYWSPTTNSTPLYAKNTGAPLNPASVAIEYSSMRPQIILPLPEEIRKLLLFGYPPIVKAISDWDHGVSLVANIKLNPKPSGGDFSSLGSNITPQSSS